MNIEWKTDKEMLEIISTRTPRGLFVCLNNRGFTAADGSDDGCYTAIDNSTGEAWTEDFRTVGEAKTWLRGDIER